MSFSPSLLLFNPDHDLALANNDVNYMPPISARRLAADLALLPLWYGEKNDFVLAASAYNAPYLESVRQNFPSLPRLITEPELKTIGEVHPIPWGWDPVVCKRLLLSGINESLLPDEESLSFIRQSSNRSVAVELLSSLLPNESYCGESYCFTCLEEVEAFVTSHPSVVLKAPLSGSGKGLNWCKGVFTVHIRNWSANILKRQGTVIAEPMYRKIVDFAMQFYKEPDGRVTFRGYSCFQTNASGAYEGNLLLSDADIEKLLSEYIPVTSLHELQRELETKLSAGMRGYNGYLGVDMMVCSLPEGYRIHPCVEVNLRMTMGMVARLFYDRYVHEGVSGFYRVAYHSSNRELQAEHERMKQFPLTLSDGKISGGYLPLVPVTPQAQYTAYVLFTEG